MSDPLSVIASVVALLDTGSKTAKHLRRLIHHFRHADDELIALSNEVNDLCLVLTEVERTSQDTTIRPQTQLMDALSTQLGRAKTKLAELETLIQSVSKVQLSGTLRVNKIAWLSKKATARGLQEHLKDVRLKICALLFITTE
ncbi:hypothetical protein MMC12_007502 [Toensbergia leucococca]|nr:hypothetical protein [Toensbergia leucococca]